MSAAGDLWTASPLVGQTVRVLKPGHVFSTAMPPVALWEGDVEAFLDTLPLKPVFDLVVTSPPYNLGKPYEKRADMDEYLLWQSRVIDKIVPRMKPTGNLCWQVGNYVENGEIIPLDIEFHPVFRAQGLQLRNRLIWHFGHGLHTKRRFSGRYEVVLWYTKTKDYVFNLDAVRIPAKYPGKRHFKGPRAGELSGNPLGKNPEDVWFIPNCKSNHVPNRSPPADYPKVSNFDSFFQPRPSVPARRDFAPRSDTHRLHRFD